MLLGPESPQGLRERKEQAVQANTADGSGTEIQSHIAGLKTEGGPGAQ